jgi:L-threonylcarbamoyladenylate synthase
LIVAPTAGNIACAADLLRNGELVAFPTETVYGLGADASNPEAVAKIFSAKGRPQDHPVIVHLPSATQMSEWAVDVPPAALELAKRYWPGPLTMVLKRAPGVSDAVTGGQDTVGIRVPAHPVAQQLLQAVGGGVAAPSANRFGRVSPTTAQHVEEEFAGGTGAKVSMILDGGASAVGIESTILDLSRKCPVLLRPGAIGAADIAAILGTEVETADARSAALQTRAPGMLDAHYAPNTPLSLLTRDELVRQLAGGNERYAVLAMSLPPNATGGNWIAAPADAAAYAHDLYANLRKLDALGCKRMLIEQPPQDAAWIAVNDRLRRAQAGSAKL